MAASRERTPYERETLIFSNPETAQAWQETVGERMERARSESLDQRREVVRDSLAEEFAQSGVAVNLIREPWTHTPAEHEEVQQLVDAAFAQDLPAALKIAQKSPHYPRNLDLFHDVLTGEMYNLLQESNISKQPLAGWILVLFTILCVAILVFLVLTTF